MTSISVVIPVFNSQGTIMELVGRLENCLDVDSEIILVDDGSSDESWVRIAELAFKSERVRGIRLGRNSGQHAALLAGIRNARNSLIATLDDDLQNPPEELNRLLVALEDDVDVVYGLPESISQPFWRSFTSRLAKLCLRSILDFGHATQASSYRVFRTRLRDSFSSPVGPEVSIDALLGWATSRFVSVNVRHDEREAGDSNYTLRRLVRFMLDTATGYSTVPLRLATSLGLATVTLSLGVLLWVLGRPLITGESVPGFPFLAATIAIFSGVQLIVLGVLGQYIGRMHFRVMNKPTYTIADRTDRISE